MKSIACFFIAVTAFVLCNLQLATANGPIVQWQKTLGGWGWDEAHAIRQSSDGGYIIVGHTYSYGEGKCDIYLVKTDSSGNMQWQRTFGGSSWDWGTSVQQTSDTGYIIAGTTDQSNICLIKTDSDGKRQWQKTFAGRGYSVQQTPDGGYIIAGECWLCGAGDWDVYLIKTDSDGDTQWERTFGGTNWDWPLSVQQTTDGGYILAGYTRSFGAGSSDVYLIKTDSNGNMQWQKAFGGSESDHGYSVQQTRDGGYIITGYTDSFGQGYRNVYLIKTDSTGNAQWEKVYGGNPDEYGRSVQQTTDGGYIVAGESKPADTTSDVYLFKTDSKGNVEWEKIFGGAEEDAAWSVQQTVDGGYIVAGYTRSYGAGSSDVYLIKLAPLIIYVDADANGLNDGTSWQNAYKYLQDGLADARSSDKPVEIRVAQGIYKPDQGTGITPGDRTAAFQLINGVTLKGGYAGFGEPDPNARDIALYQTILYGNIGRLLDISDNCYHVFYHPEGLNLGDTAILDGFTITGGNANGSWPQNCGSGMYNYGSSPTVKDCTFKGNSAGTGGGMYNGYSNPSVNNCTFSDNSAEYGGGMLNYNSSPTVKDCTFSSNSADWGGGLETENSSNPTLIGCTFKGNSAAMSGGGIRNHNSSPNLLNCFFIENKAQCGGAVHNDNESSRPFFNRCTFINNSASGFGGAIRNHTSSPTVSNCLVIGNRAQHGGGIHNENDRSNPTVINCTFFDNFASGLGGGIINNSSKPILSSSILWANRDSGGIDESAQIHEGVPIINYTCILGWTGILGGTGNTGSNPLLAADGYHLRGSSPCINAGNPNYVAGPNETDIDGELRVMLGRVDMGADEFNPFEVTFDVVGRRRISRALFGYECNVTLRNISLFTVKNIQLEIIKASENMVITDPNVAFGDIEIGPWESAISIDTCTFQVDRSQPIDPDKIVWKVKCQRADTGMPLELTINGVGSGALDDAGDGKIDLAGLVKKWLWTGDAGSIEEDITGDGIVNLADFAVLAGQQLEGREHENEWESKAR